MSWNLNQLIPTEPFLVEFVQIKRCPSQMSPSTHQLTQQQHSFLFTGALLQCWIDSLGPRRSGSLSHFEDSGLPVSRSNIKIATILCPKPCQGLMQCLCLGLQYIFLSISILLISWCCMRHMLALVQPVFVISQAAEPLMSVLPWLPRAAPTKKDPNSDATFALPNQLLIAVQPCAVAALGQTIRHGRCLAWPWHADHRPVGTTRCCPRPHQQPGKWPWSVSPKIAI